jgi:hypothetical protein
MKSYFGSKIGVALPAIEAELSSRVPADQLRAMAVSPAGAVRNPSRAFTVQITAITLLSIAAAYGCAFFLGTRTPNLLSVYAGWSIVGLILVGGSAVFAYTILLLIRREPRPLRLVWARAREYLTPSALADRVLPIFLVFSFLAGLSVFKSLIPRMHPFAWDAAFSDLDRLIFGTDPWRITHAIIGPVPTALIDYAYIMWVPVFTCVVFWHSVFAPHEQKRRFFLSFFGCWIVLGIIGATIFSSAGPCFLDLIHHPYAERYPFFPLEYGRGSQRIMDYLADGYRTGDFGIAKGISAMPSMHIALVTLYLASARKPWTMALAVIYFTLIFVGSVHLGWHYAVDGIVAAIGVALIYATISIGYRDRSRTIVKEAPALA